MSLLFLCEEEFEKYQLNFLRVIYADQENFQWAIRSIRVVLGLPPEGIIVEINNGKIQILEKAHRDLMNKIDFNKLTISASIVLGMYNLPRTWLPTIETVIIMNVAFPLTKLEQIEVLSDLKITKLSELTNVFRKKPINTSQDQFVIVVRDGFQSNYNTFIKFLTKNKKKEIVDALSRLPSNPKIKGGINLPMLLRMEELKSSGVKWESIADTLDKEFDVSDRLQINVDLLKKYHTRFKKTLLGSISINPGYAKILRGTS